MADSQAPQQAIAQLSLGQDGSEESPTMVPPMPPAMRHVQGQTVDEIVKDMKRMPLFMTDLEDAEGEENMELEALKALAYEGTRAEIAQNFREQGNDLAKVKRWGDAKEYYDKAIAALRAPRKDEEFKEITDEEAEIKREADIAEACHVNRALCNLEKKNYRSCNLDCASALRLNPRNIKAWYRSASACLALDKLPEAEDACARGLEIEGVNSALIALQDRIQRRREHLGAVERERLKRLEHERAKAQTLKLALKERGIMTRTTKKAPDMEDAELKLESPLDKASTLSLPVVLLYSIDLQSDFVKAFKETDSLLDHLEYIFPLPWDESGQYKSESVDCYLETVAGGLIKAGKKLPLAKIMASGKVEVVDGLLKVHVIPKAKANGWIEEFKKRTKR